MKVIKMRLFVIGGKSGSGKSTLAKMIKEHYNKLGEKTIITGFPFQTHILIYMNGFPITV